MIDKQGSYDRAQITIWKMRIMRTTLSVVAAVVVVFMAAAASRFPPCLPRSLHGPQR